MIFEADPIDVARLTERSRKKAKLRHDGEIEDCDFLWQGDGEGMFAWLEMMLLNASHLTVPLIRPMVRCAVYR